MAEKLGKCSSTNALGLVEWIRLHVYGNGIRSHPDLGSALLYLRLPACLVMISCAQFRFIDASLRSVVTLLHRWASVVRAEKQPSRICLGPTDCA